MGSKFIKRKKKGLGMPSFIQLKSIKKAFPNSKIIKKSWDGFDVLVELQPTAISEIYTVKISYTGNSLVRVYVVDKNLKLAPNRKKLPHVYSTERQQLCLYSPSKSEWKPTKFISNTIIPWASEWLYYYELWLPEGKWYGGGHDEYPYESKEFIVNEE